MKEIRVRIADKVFKGLQAEVALINFTEGCVAPPSILERCMIGIILKMGKNSDEVTITLPGLTEQKETE